jgi:hypothetical protein
MSHPDPCYDPDNSYEDDDMFTEPNESDVPFAEYLYNDYNDFHYGEVDADELENGWDDSYDDSMDGDHESGLASAGWGTDEDYGYYGDDTPLGEDYYGGE